MSFIGMWHITEMEQWGEEYFNMDGQAYGSKSMKTILAVLSLDWFLGS